MPFYWERLDARSILPGEMRPCRVMRLLPCLMIKIEWRLRALSLHCRAAVIGTRCGHSFKALRPQARRSFDKSSHSITLTLPSEGLFDVSIVDHLNTPRIDLLVAAVHATSRGKSSQIFSRCSCLLTDWNEDYQGWPIHDFQRCYLRSVLLHIPPSAQWDRWQHFTSQRSIAWPMCSGSPGFLPHLACSG